MESQDQIYVLELKAACLALDWQLGPSLFMNLMERWGQCDGDLFVAKHC